MRRFPMLICGALTVSVGVAMLVVGQSIEGLVWFAAPIAALGVVLFAFGLRSKPSTSPDVGHLPGRWYPFAIIGIAVALCCWAIYWTKYR